MVQGFHYSDPHLDSISRYKEALRWVYSSAFPFVDDMARDILIETIVGGASVNARELGVTMDLRVVAFSFITFYLSGQFERDLKPREVSMIGIVIEDNIPDYI